MPGSRQPITLPTPEGCRRDLIENRCYDLKQVTWRCSSRDPNKITRSVVAAEPDELTSGVGKLGPSRHHLGPLLYYCAILVRQPALSKSKALSTQRSRL